jgi:hypothetical protein
MLRINAQLLVLRVFLATLFAFLLLMQVMSMPGEFIHDVRESPQAAHLLWPMLAVVEIGLLCAQVVIVCTWKLLTLVRKDSIFSDASFAWVNGIVRAVIYFTPELRDPGTPILLFGMVLFGAVLVLLMLVMRALLRQATALRADMEAVI